MRKLIIGLLVLAGSAGCTSSKVMTPNAYSDGASQRNLSVMVHCAGIISKAPVPLTDDERNWHYQRCLIQNGATI